MDGTNTRVTSSGENSQSDYFRTAEEKTLLLPEGEISSSKRYRDEATGTDTSNSNNNSKTSEGEGEGDDAQPATKRMKAYASSPKQIDEKSSAENQSKSKDDGGGVVEIPRNDNNDNDNNNTDSAISSIIDDGKNEGANPKIQEKRRQQFQQSEFINDNNDNNKELLASPQPQQRSPPAVFSPVLTRSRKQQKQQENVKTKSATEQRQDKSDTTATAVTSTSIATNATATGKKPETVDTANAIANADTNDVEKTKLQNGRWRVHQMAEDYVSLVGKMMYPVTQLRPYGFDSAKREYPLEGISVLGYLQSPLRRPTIIEKWSPYEIAIFEAALLHHGKEFHLVSRAVATKSTKDVIDFYYIWKKTDHYKKWKDQFIPDAELLDPDYLSPVKKKVSANSKPSAISSSGGGGSSSFGAGGKGSGGNNSSNAKS